MVWECFLLVNEKYNPITQESKPCTPKPILTVGGRVTRGEPYREDLKQEVRALRVWRCDLACFAWRRACYTRLDTRFGP